jgi:hypothetical protein
MTLKINILKNTVTGELSAGTTVSEVEAAYEAGRTVQLYIREVNENGLESESIYTLLGAVLNESEYGKRFVFVSIWQSRAYELTPREDGMYTITKVID